MCGWSGRHPTGHRALPCAANMFSGSWSQAIWLVGSRGPGLVLTAEWRVQILKTEVGLLPTHWQVKARSWGWCQPTGRQELVPGVWLGPGDPRAECQVLLGVGLVPCHNSKTWVPGVWRLLSEKHSSRGRAWAGPRAGAGVPCGSWSCISGVPPKGFPSGSG